MLIRKWISFSIQLRISLQEILDSIHDEDGRSDVAIVAPSLEKVLTILDARHVVGQYHPAMALKARIEKLEGVNAGLRFFLKWIVFRTLSVYQSEI